MLTALVLGLLFGLGLLSCVRGLVAPRPALADALRDLDLERLDVEHRDLEHGGEARERPSPGTTGTHPTAVRWARAAAGAVGVDLGQLRRDLRVTGRTIERHALDKVIAGTSFFAFPVVVAGLLVAGGVGVPWGLVAVGCLAAGAGGFLVPDLTIRSEAERRRREFRHALAAYLDLVVIVVAGGGGTEGALHDAAEAGSGWAFTEIRRALAGSRLAAGTPWAALRELGDDLGVVELTELAAGVSLAGEHGARVRASLTAKARSTREQQLTEAETEAQAATERMSVPVVLLLFGFLAFILYPALQFVLQGL